MATLNVVMDIFVVTVAENSFMLTTYEMDGLFTQEDIDNRYKVMRQCRDCKKWSQMQVDEHPKCAFCGEINYDPLSTKSLRTYNPQTDNKRKPKVKK